MIGHYGWQLRLYRAIGCSNWFLRELRMSGIKFKPRCHITRYSLQFVVPNLLKDERSLFTSCIWLPTSCFQRINKSFHGNNQIHSSVTNETCSKLHNVRRISWLLIKLMVIELLWKYFVPPPSPRPRLPPRAHDALIVYDSFIFMKLKFLYFLHLSCQFICHHFEFQSQCHIMSRCFFENIHRPLWK